MRFLNQARDDSLWLLCAWFLEIAFVRNVGMWLCACMCVHPRGYRLHLHDVEPIQPAEQVCCV